MATKGHSPVCYCCAKFVRDMQPSVNAPIGGLIGGAHQLDCASDTGTFGTTAVAVGHLVRVLLTRMYGPADIRNLGRVRIAEVAVMSPA